MFCSPLSDSIPFNRPSLFIVCGAAIMGPVEANLYSFLVWKTIMLPLHRQYLNGCFGIFISVCDNTLALFHQFMIIVCV